MAMLKPSQSHSGGVIVKPSTGNIAQKKNNPILRLGSPWQPSNYISLRLKTRKTTPELDYNFKTRLVVNTSSRPTKVDMTSRLFVKDKMSSKPCNRMISQSIPVRRETCGERNGLDNIRSPSSNAIMICAGFSHR